MLRGSGPAGGLDSSAHVCLRLWQHAGGPGDDTLAGSKVVQQTPFKQMVAAPLWVGHLVRLDNEELRTNEAWCGLMCEESTKGIRRITWMCQRDKRDKKDQSGHM